MYTSQYKSVQWSSFTSPLTHTYTSHTHTHTHTHTTHTHLREIQLQQMHKTTASIGDTTDHFLVAFTQSSFTLPFVVVVLVAVVLFLCRQRRPRHYTLSRNTSHLSFGRSTSYAGLGSSQSSSRLSSIMAATSGSTSTSFFVKGVG